MWAVEGCIESRGEDSTTLLAFGPCARKDISLLLAECFLNRMSWILGHPAASPYRLLLSSSVVRWMLKILGHKRPSFHPVTFGYWVIYGFDVAARFLCFLKFDKGSWCILSRI
jgi:hypothetical protein